MPVIEKVNGRSFGFVHCFTAKCAVKSVLCLFLKHLSVLLLLLQCRSLLVGVCCWQSLQFIHLPSLLSCSHSRSSVVSVVLVFNASISALAPSAPMLFPACWCLLLAMAAIYASSTLSSYSPCSFSVLSVVLIFNASLSALAPFIPMLLTACLCLLLAKSAIHPSCTFFLLTFQIQFLECCVDLQCLAQCDCSFITNLVVCLLVFVVGNVSTLFIFNTFLHTSQFQ